mgnify:CR=1 FL=1
MERNNGLHNVFHDGNNPLGFVIKRKNYFFGPLFYFMILSMLAGFIIASVKAIIELIEESNEEKK